MSPRTHTSPVTDEQLRLAWRHINRPGWPATLEAALANPTYSICLHALARQLNRPGFAYQHPVKPAPVLHSPPPVPAGIPRRQLSSAGRFDGKRAAANDLKDD